jgi:hypothetical protein
MVYNSFHHNLRGFCGPLVVFAVVLDKVLILIMGVVGDILNGFNGNLRVVGQISNLKKKTRSNIVKHISNIQCEYCGKISQIFTCRFCWKMLKNISAFHVNIIEKCLIEN